LRYAFCIEFSILPGVPSDHGPAERHICNSQVPVNPNCVSSPGLNSGGGNKKGMTRVWFCKRRNATNKPSVGACMQANTNLYSQQVVPSLRNRNTDIINNKSKRVFRAGLTAERNVVPDHEQAVQLFA
jgi:hypothetical protein